MIPPPPITAKEVYQWIFDTSLHVMHIEYFLTQLQIGKEDPQRPHDIVGPGNKFEWTVIQGLASQYLPKGEIRYLPQIKASLALHRQQYHHQQWNINHASAPDDSLNLGAIDAICSLLENRPYQGGKHTYGEIYFIICNNPDTKFFTLDRMIKDMQRIRQPPLDRILSLREFPNIGIPAQSYDHLTTRIQETITQLKQEHKLDVLKCDPYYQRSPSSPAISGCR
jgi:hypothetical protein